MYQLVSEVFDHAPASLTPTEVLFLAVLAEDTRTPGEVREIGTDDLCRRVRVDRRGLRHVIARLDRHGIKVRVAIGVDSSGRPLYAVPGRLPKWRLPALQAPAECPCRTCVSPLPEPVDNSAEGGHQRPPGDKTAAQKGGHQRPPSLEGGHTGPAGGHARPAAGHPSPPGGHTSPPFPSRDVPVLDQGSRPTLGYVVDQTGATEDEARLILKTVTKRYRPRSVGAYIRGMRKDDLRELLAEHRDAHRPAPGAGMPDPCGKCGPGRLIPLDDGRAKRCPTCHPGVVRRTA
jgi:hypothetical protein